VIAARYVTLLMAMPEIPLPPVPEHQARRREDDLDSGFDDEIHF